MAGLTAAEVLQRRRARQRLTGPGLSSATAVVELLAGVQAQEREHALWSLGLRTAGLTAEQVRTEYRQGRFLRTHVLRPTWHFVAAEDLGWILRATAPRVHQRNAGMYRTVGLDPATLDRTAAVVQAALAGGGVLTRTELGAALAAEGLVMTAGTLAHAVMWCELEGLICSGPTRGATDTYQRIDERVDATRARRPDRPVTELLRRFLLGHGPATVADFTRWSSLTAAAARQSLAELTEQDLIERAEVAGLTVWWVPSDPEPPPTEPGRAWLLPLYDELTLSYPTIRVPRPDDHPHRPGTDQFVGCVLVAGLDDRPEGQRDRPEARPDAGRDIGLWRRTVHGDTVRVELDLAPGCSAAERAAARQEAERLATFLGKALVCS